MKISLKYLDYLFLTLVLFLSTGAGQSKILDVSSADRINQGNGLLQATWSCVYLVVLLRLVRKRHAVMELVRRNRALAFLILLTVVSALWSAAPSFSLRHAIALTLTSLFAVDLATSMPLYRQLQIIEPLCVVILVASAVAELFFPGFFPTANFGLGSATDVADSDAWSGVFIHKNDFGHFIAFAMLVALVRTPLTRHGKILRVLWILATFVLIVKSHSSTGLAVMLLMLACVQWLFRLRWTLRTRKLAVLAAVGLGVPLLILATQDASVITGLLGRDATLTGRTILWRLSAASALQHPILGFGYEGFWTVTSGADQIRYLIGWDAPHAHNAYIEIALELGLAGLLAFVLAVVTILRRSAVFLRLHAERERMWPMAYILLTLIYGITEGSPLASNTIMWICFVAAACTVSMTPEGQFRREHVGVERQVESHSAVPA